MSKHLSEQEIIRREKLTKIQEAGINPFPAPLYPVNAFSTDIKSKFYRRNKRQL
jgi:lysyl-tRNA synthetase class 2